MTMPKQDAARFTHEAHRDSSETHKTRSYRRETRTLPKQLLDGIVDRCLPEHIAEWGRCLFRFSRILRGIPELQGAHARHLRGILDQWHRRAAPYAPDIETAWDHFQTGYLLVHTPIRFGGSFLELTEQEMQTMKTDEWVDEYTGTMQRLIRVCVVMDRLTNGPFFLSSRVAGELCHVSHIRAAKCLVALRQEGILQLVVPAKGREAATYQLRAPA